MKRALICTAIVLAGAAPAYVLPRVMAGNSASVGPVRAAYHCEPACQRDPILMPPALPPVRSFGVEHYGHATPVPAPGALVFLPFLPALAWLRRGSPSPSQRGGVLRFRRHLLTVRSQLGPAQFPQRRPILSERKS